MVAERDMLADLGHPYLCNMRYAFQDRRIFALILDFEEGGDLRYYINRYTFSEKAVRSIIAEVACALEYIHGKGIVHRDVKPENILIDADGHAHLCDFNVAARISPKMPLLRHVAGTFQYLSPEMHQQIPYDHHADWWALGVVFYELIYGTLPFKAPTRRHLVKKMTSRGLKLPHTKPPVSPDCEAAIRRFLHNRIAKRVHCLDDALVLPFFYGLCAKEVEANWNHPGAIHIDESDMLLNAVTEHVPANDDPLQLTAHKQRGSMKRLPVAMRIWSFLARRSTSIQAQTPGAPVSFTAEYASLPSFRRKDRRFKAYVDPATSYKRISQSTVGSSTLCDNSEMLSVRP